MVIVSMIMAILPIQLTSADPGSSLPNSPFNAGDAKLDTNPKVTFLDDPTNTQSDTSYKSGAKENQECVEPTFHKNPPHKDDFAKVWGGFASGVDGTGGFAYLAWQRQSQGQGTATLEFELNQSSALCPNTQFGIHPRTVGDLLLEFNFSGGAGAADSFDERIWNGTEWGPEQPLPANSYEASGFETFGEITIDVHALPGQPCFTFGFGRNRSSNSFQAELKDFIGGIPLGTCTPPPPKTYVCSPPGATNITETSATLNGSTDDPDASTATFDLTGPGGSSTTKSLVNGKASADVTGLTANTQYSYTVAFKDAGGTTLGTSSACPFTTLPHHNVHLTLDVTKNNDANQDGVYSPSEPATSPNEDVSFRVRVTNPSSNGVAIKIDSPVTDVFPVGGANPTTKNVCDPDLVGKVLQPGDFVECTFTVANYPITFTSGNVVDRVTVTAHENNNSSNTVTNSAESTVTPPTPTLSLTVNKANDANQDGTYSKSEQANTAPQNVKFRATFANSSAVAVKITSLSDVYPSPSGSVTLSPAQMSPACAALIGTQIPAGQSATCDFTVNNYPLVRGGSSITNTVSATVVDVTNPNNTVTKTDTSTVVPPPVVLSLDVTKANDANQDGQYNQTETALTDLQDVKFRATFHNTSADAAQIVSLSDVFPGTTLTAAQMSPACAALIGTQIPAGQSASCDFTVARYPVQAGHPPVQDTITIKVQEVNNPSNTLTKTATSTVNPPNVLSLTVTKANDANQDGTYSKSETANTAPQNVKFRATFANSSAVAVKITTLSDVYPSPTGMVTLSPTDMSPACAALIGTQIPAGQSATCDFTVNNYPLVEGGSAITNTVSATVVDVTNPTNTKTDTDTSTVTPPGIPLLALNVTKANDANQDGQYTQTETALTDLQDVKFRATFQNPSTNVPVQIVSLSDAFSGTTLTAAQMSPTCAALIGTQIPAGQSASCDFTVARYPVQAGHPPVQDTITIKVQEVNNPSNNLTKTATSTVNPPNLLSLTVTKANDANQDGTYSKSETANTAPQNVKFRATFANSSAVAVKITTLSDVYPSPTGMVTLSPTDMSPACAALIGTQIPAGQSATCDFTVNNYPLVQGGSAITNTVSATVVDVTNPTNTTTDTDTSTVTPPIIRMLSLDVTKANDANQDGQYNQTEMALTDLQDVKFRATFHNSSPLATVQIVSLSDVFPGTTLTAAEMSPACAALIGTQIDPGQSASCDFTVAKYPVQAGHPPVQDTITIKVQEVNNPSNTLTKTATSTVNPPNVLSLTVTKANDANQDGTYSKTETAKSAPQNVKFRAKFANSSPVAVKITELSDVYPSPSGPVTLSPTQMSPACAALIGTQIPAGQSATCDFTVNNYPLVQGGNSITNTVSATVVDVTNPNNTLTETDTSTVNAPPKLTLNVVKENDADQDGVFHGTESAKSAPQDVQFRVTVTNTSSVPVVVDPITDAYLAVAPFPVNSADCTNNLVGKTLAPNATGSCVFTVTNYPVDLTKPGIVNTVSVPIHEVTNPGNTTTGTSTSTVNPPNVLSLNVVKANDANQDGTYSKSETAKSAPQNVKFRATFANASGVAVKITALSDVYPSPSGPVTLSPAQMSPACAALIGTEIPAGQSATCDFTVNNYPLVQGGSAITNTVSTTVVDVTNPNNTTTKTDTSTVTPPRITVPARLTVTKTNDANQDGTYSPSEAAKSPNQDVSFRVRVTNPNAFAVQIDPPVTDLFPVGGTNPTTTNVCNAELVGKVLQPGDFVECTFTARNYPVTFTSGNVTDRVTVTAHENNNPSNTVTNSATSTVTPPTPQLGLTVVKTNNAAGSGFAKSSQATAEHEDVPFQITVTNTSPVDVVIDGLTDAVPVSGTPVDVLTYAGTCRAQLVGKTLAANTGTATCTFTVPNYPVTFTSGAVVDQVVVSGHQTNNPGRPVSGADTSTVNPPIPPLTLTVDKTNNADGKGFADISRATAPNQDVPFQVTVTNTSPVAVVIDGLTDAVPVSGTPVDVLTFAGQTCTAQLVGKTLAANTGSATCTFTVPNYPVTFTSGLVVDRVVVTGHESGNTGHTVTGQDISTVQPPIRLGMLVVKTNDADGDGQFHIIERAKRADEDIPFRITATNTSSVPIFLDRGTDLFPIGGTSSPVDITSYSGDCALAALRRVLQPGDHVSCTFTVTGFPIKVGGQDIQDRATVFAHDAADSPDNPQAQLFSFADSTVQPPPQLTLNVVKTNDANGDGTFNPTESAKTAPQDVQFKVTVTNTSGVSVVVDPITDAYLSVSPFPVNSADCTTNLVGKTLASNATGSCVFTVTNYPIDTSKAGIVDTVSVPIHEVNNPGNTTTGTSTSTVNPPNVLSLNVVKANDANKDLTFSGTEQAKSAPQDVQFLVTVTNTSVVPVVVDSITDAYLSVAPFPIDSPDCTNNVLGKTLAPGATVRCVFTISNYPLTAGGSAIVNTISVPVHEVNNPGNTTTGTSTSTVNPPPLNVLSVTVVKTNDANGDGNFTPDESAPKAGTPVTFHAVITNTSAVDVRVTAITDEWPGMPAFDLSTDCPGVIGTVLAPNQSVTCAFTVQNYSPAVGVDQVDTVRTTVVENNNPNNSTPGQGSSTVRSLTAVLPLVITPPPATPNTSPLPVTGTNSVFLGWLGLVLTLFGGGILSLPWLRRRFDQQGRPVPNGAIFDNE